MILYVNLHEQVIILPKINAYLIDVFYLICFSINQIRRHRLRVDK